jgi:hypothetical protein
MSKKENSMSARERFHAAMSFKPFDRLPVIELCVWWDKTIERWRSEGLPAGLEDRYDICRHFGLDIIYQHIILNQLPGLPAPAAEGAGIASDTDGYRRLLPLLYPRDKILDTSLLYKWTVQSSGLLREWKKEQEAGDAVIRFTLYGFFWFPRVLLGVEGHLCAFYDQPDLIHMINQDLSDFYVRALDAIFDACGPDLIVLSEDMCYKNGPMLSKKHFDEFLLPYYRKIIPLIRERGTLVMIDSDGDVGSAAAWFEEAGFQGVLPMERQAGADAASLRKKHPDMRFIGGFDKTVMSRGEDAMRREFERLLPTAAAGGHLINCDHQTPPQVSYSDYQLYLRLFREYASRAAQRRTGFSDTGMEIGTKNTLHTEVVSQ